MACENRYGVWVDKAGAKRISYQYSDIFGDDMLYDDMLYKEILELYHKFRLLHYRRVFGKIRERDGSLSATEAYAVDVIYLLGNPTLGEFAECLSLSQPNATYKVNNLMAKGYVTKTVSKTDRRECKLCVTEKFFSYYGVKNRSIEDAIAVMEQRYPPEKLEEFIVMLRAFTAAMEEKFE